MVDRADSETAIGIVGLGPRGLVVLERLVWAARQRPHRSVTAVIFEPGVPGVGVHSPDQPDYLMLNTIAGQLSIFADFGAAGGRLERLGPTFHEWCVTRDVRMREDRDAHCAERRASELDYLPRRRLGQYLAWSFEHLCTLAPPNLRIVLHRQKVIDIVALDDASGLTLHGADGERCKVAHAFVTIGHTGRKRKSGDAFIDVIPGPVGCTATQTLLADVSAGERIAIAGLGLTSADLISALTLGRGGRFVRCADNGLRYVRSGREPRMLVYSRSGLPFFSRPDTTLTRERHKPVFLTAERVAMLRRRAGSLDFVRDVLPIMKDEMRAAFYLTAAMLAEPASVVALRGQMTGAQGQASIERIFSACASRFGPFDPDTLLRLSVPACGTGQRYPEWLLSFLKDDIAESRKGLAASPRKAALEVWRDLRDALRDLANYGGFSAQSHALFYGPYSALINRMVAGPQKERHEDLVALIDAGIVEIFPGVNPDVRRDERTGSYTIASRDAAAADIRPRVVSRVLAARVDSSGVHESGSALLASLHVKGIVTPVQPAMGLDGVRTDSDGHPIGIAGEVASNLWIFGPCVEGASYYNHYVPSPGAPSRAVSDAHRAVLCCIDGVAAMQTA
ncbi:FAD/NAD(P)-binding protein [Burkholderia singularis]|uniref:Nitrogen regulatory protein P-II n=1 Tax=Burkholderia singularis TaxID=1503053 RepID=A0A238HAM7_9BURK|nr:FAD/NAD(P)-binding protein [Burkholderia singularis]SMG02238.1 Nitrogen regulatory protein P-II [Burkholderia singularis]